MPVSEEKGEKDFVMDFWASKIHAAKHFNSAHLTSDSNHLVLDDSEVNDDARTYFTCPFCCVDIELSLLCTHLQEEHCFSVTNAVCPVCALNLGKDVIGHFKVHHANSLKGRRKTQKSGFWSNSTLQEITSFRSLNTRNNTTNNVADDSAPDPLLTTFLCRMSFPDSNADSKQDTLPSDDVSINLESESLKQDTNQAEDYEKRMERVSFVQQMVLSTFI